MLSDLASSCVYASVTDRSLALPLRNIQVFQKQRERVLLEDLAFILYAMLFGVTLPTNKDEMLEQYLVRRQRSFCFAYFIRRQSIKQLHFVRISRGDRFALSLDGTGIDSRGRTWQLVRFEGPTCVKCIAVKRSGPVRC